MFKKLLNLFVIKTKFEAFAIIYAIAVGAVARGFQYMEQYPGVIGYIFFAACAAVVFMAGGKILDAVDFSRQRKSEGKGGSHGAVNA